MFAVITASWMDEINSVLWFMVTMMSFIGIFRHQCNSQAITIALWIMGIVAFMRCLGTLFRGTATLDSLLMAVALLIYLAAEFWEDRKGDPNGHNRY